MASAENQQQTFPTKPPSLSAGDHEMRDYYAPQDISRPTLNQAPYLTPYLGLRARLSQIWINRWTILLLLVLVRTLIAITSIDQNLDSARAQALSACKSVENAGSTMASMPHYMSAGVNELAATGVEKAVNGLMGMLQLTVTGVEEIVLFVINLMTSTYVCLITFAISGSLHAAISLVEDISGFVNKTVGAIGDDIGNVAGAFTNDLNKLIGSLNSLPFGGTQVPKLDLSDDINKLHGLSIPSSFTDGLNKLNQSIPNFADVQNFTNGVIRLPFEKVKQLINESLHTYEFNRSAFPVPQKQTLQFCTGSNGINDFFDSLVELEQVAKKVFIAVLLILAIAACGPMAWWEIKRWRKMQERSQLVQKQASDPMDVVYIASRPHTASVGIKLANRFSSIRRQTVVRWAVAYVTSPPALFILSLGIAGLFSCLCQYILLQIIRKEAPALENQVSAFAEKVVAALNESSEAWANGTNSAIIATNNDINSNIFGWVNTSTVAVNDTLNAFVDAMSDGLDKVFGGTILEDPIKEVLNCLIGLKIEGIQKGLTWIHDNAHIDFPLFNNDTFSIGALASISDSDADNEFLAAPGSKTKDEISGAVIKVLNQLESGIHTEVIISIVILLLWLILLIVGLIRVALAFAGQGKTRAEGGQNYFVDPQTSAYRGDNSYTAEQVQQDRHMSSAPPQYTKESYTLSPRPFPTFSNTGNATDQEKVGTAGRRSFDVIEPTHLRKSSYGHMGGISPISPVNEKARNNPFI
jgi:hypothetical protein